MNAAQPVEDAKFAEELDKPMQYKFRDFSYEWFADDKEGMAMGLRYEQEGIHRPRKQLIHHVLRPEPAADHGEGGGRGESVIVSERPAWAIVSIVRM